MHSFPTDGLKPSKLSFVTCVFSYYVILSVVVSNVLPQGPDDDHTQNTWEKKRQRKEDRTEISTFHMCHQTGFTLAQGHRYVATSQNANLRHKMCVYPIRFLHSASVFLIEFFFRPGGSARWFTAAFNLSWLLLSGSSVNLLGCMLQFVLSGWWCHVHLADLWPFFGLFPAAV